MKIKILQFEIKEADFEANKDTIESLISENYKNTDIIAVSYTHLTLPTICSV